MAKLFPFRPESHHESAGPRLVNLDDDVADDVFAALSSETARTILSRFYHEPATASDVAEAADTSLQNARYHIEKLESAGLIESVDTWYSSRGTEMTVYAPTNEPLVVAAGNEESKGVLRKALERVVGAVTLLAFASVLVDRLVREFGAPGLDEYAREPGFDTAEGSPTDAATHTTTSVDPGVAMTETETAAAAETSTPVAMETSTQGDTPTAAVEATSSRNGSEAVPQSTSPTPDPETTELTANATDTPGNLTVTPVETVTEGADLLSSLPPGALFFAGGLLVLALITAWWYWSEYRPVYGRAS